MPILIFTTGITLDYLFLEPQRRRSSSGTRPSLTGRRTTRRPTWWSLRSAAASRSHLSCHQAWWWADTAPATEETGSDWAELALNCTRSVLRLSNSGSVGAPCHQEYSILALQLVGKNTGVIQRVRRTQETANQILLIIKARSIGKTKTRYGPLRFIRIWQNKLWQMHADMSLQYDLIVKYFSLFEIDTNIRWRAHWLTDWLTWTIFRNKLTAHSIP